MSTTPDTTQIHTKAEAYKTGVQVAFEHCIGCITSAERVFTETNVRNTIDQTVGKGLTPAQKEIVTMATSTTVLSALAALKDSFEHSLASIMTMEVPK